MTTFKMIAGILNRGKFLIVLLLLSFPVFTHAQITNPKDAPEKQVTQVVESITQFTDAMYGTTTWRSFLQMEAANTPIDYNDIDYNLLNAAVFFYTNKYRESQKLKPFIFSPILRNAAVFHSLEMVNRKFYDHTNPYNKGMKTCMERCDFFDFSGNTVGENIAYEFLFDYKPKSTFWADKDGDYYDYYYGNNKKKGETIPPLTYAQYAERIVQQWIESPDHRHNLQNKNFKYLGCGVIIDYRSVKQTHIPEAVGTQNFGG